MQSICSPWRISTPVGQDGDALAAVDAIAGWKPLLAQRLVPLQRPARFAAIEAIGDIERVFIGERGLDAGPRTHVGADLLTHESGERIGGETSGCRSRSRQQRVR